MARRAPGPQPRRVMPTAPTDTSPDRERTSRATASDARARLVAIVVLLAVWAALLLWLLASIPAPHPV
jgi:hypothetical protein